MIVAATRAVHVGSVIVGMLVVPAVPVAVVFAMLVVADLAALWWTRGIRSPLDPGSRPDPATPRVG